jgi:integral membrane protein
MQLANQANKKRSIIRVFSDREAWLLFRLAAFGESIGWTFLISGVLLKKYVTHGVNWPVAIGGQIHGTLFILYLAVSILAGPSLAWRPRKALLAVAVSVPPYGSLVFERYEAKRRHALSTAARRELRVWAVIQKGNYLLALQPASSGSWRLPGGSVLAGETIATALARTTTAETLIAAEPDQLLRMQESTVKGNEILDFYYGIKNQSDYASYSATKSTTTINAIDELRFINPTSFTLFEAAQSTVLEQLT